MSCNVKINNITLKNRIIRLLWNFVWFVFFRPTPRPFHVWRCLLLRMFGAKLGSAVHVYPSARIWAPWNLEMGDHACLGEQVDCYCVERISIGKHSTVSQYSFLCSASHDYTKASMPLVAAPISIGGYVWITADVFVGPGVTIGDGAVVTTRSTVFNDLPAWMVARGTPAVPVKPRELDIKDSIVNS